ncbi:MAG: hypothetical protein Ct9H300mP27_10110 [Chloroflexota bacterium]|nr:MAG: hypothetical protein Ct9H300mP27_10110 [Chloroflexota bacterium]
MGNTILVVMMDVESGHEAEFDRWYNEEHLPERLEIPGYVSARRFKLEEGNGVLKYLCIWELEDESPLESDQYKMQRAVRVRSGMRLISILLNGRGAYINRFIHWERSFRRPFGVLP